MPLVLTPELVDEAHNIQECGAQLMLSETNWKEVFESYGRKHLECALDTYLSEKALYWGPYDLTHEKVPYTPGYNRWSCPQVGCRGWRKNPLEEQDIVHNTFWNMPRVTPLFVACTKGHKDFQPANHTKFVQTGPMRWHIEINAVCEYVAR